ncbi:hypothetical protein RclHR1_06830004 [Rhizophagus clarus]|uniref:Reelin domain-containing protein n=1 Tax=Rhizophagus clarus TaxID=94130 RepID=A0A2Z6RTU7_9GLOM|nr:hypothetical protein RclHR1_06830004 [Rhizophagus clarus]GES76118.1 hypothetical protein GLOIN_2v1476737 [Rhizophagus clarus]
MNQKYFIISFTLLVVFFLTNVDGCHPSGNGGPCGDDNPKCPQIIDAHFTNGALTITVQTDKDLFTGPQAFGHFTFHADSGVGWEFYKHPQFVNDYSCNHGRSSSEANPFTSTWLFDPSQTPSNTWFDIWISIYTDCGNTIIEPGPGNTLCF